MSIFSLSQFVVPERYQEAPFDFFAVRTAVILPTYKPGSLTARLVRDLVLWNKNLHVYVVDDCTPDSYKPGVNIFRRIQAMGDRVTVLRTPTNKLKAGALNHALKKILALSARRRPHVVITLDDDVMITRTTVRNLVLELMRYTQVGAVCSQCAVFNKKTNLLTRLQGLEYQGFNATRLADDGFYGGPLVMHGMLTAFRTQALSDVGGFTEGHLIEDYEITTRLKVKGWRVKAAVNAVAWTIVPETVWDLWRQRTRWSYGGMVVVANSKTLAPVLQDALGHGVFITTILMIDSLLFLQGDGVPHTITYWIFGFAFLQLGIWYVFQLWLMRLYRDRDWVDWGVRVSLLPEFMYSNMLSLVLVGSYLFFGFNILARRVPMNGNFLARVVIPSGRRLFLDFGYTDGWGTRASS